MSAKQFLLMNYASDTIIDNLELVARIMEEYAQVKIGDNEN